MLSSGENRERGRVGGMKRAVLKSWLWREEGHDGLVVSAKVTCTHGLLIWSLNAVLLSRWLRRGIDHVHQVVYLQTHDCQIGLVGRRWPADHIERDEKRSHFQNGSDAESCSRICAAWKERGQM